MEKPQIAILGSGPTGLEAALAAAEHGYPFTVYEAAPQVAGHIRDWAHVHLFTPWSLDVSPRMRKALAIAGRSVPESDDCPSGADLVEQVLEPLAELPALKGYIRLGTRVERVGREGLLKHEEIGSDERAARRFRLLVSNGTSQQVEHADIVLDCTGNTDPNPVGNGGIPAPGEEAASELISSQIPDLEETLEAWRFLRVLIVGAGHSAQTALCELVDKGIEVVWALRGEKSNLGLAEDDPLPARADLTQRALSLAENPPSNLAVLRGVVVEAIERDGEEAVVTLLRTNGKTTKVRVGRILALTGKVGNHQLYRQLQVHECYATSGPMKLAAALMGASGGGGDCLAQTSLGPETLKNPEPGFFILGLKSYGRRSDFLMRVGWEQVDEVFQLLTD